jgi:hypothetical protein
VWQEHVEDFAKIQIRVGLSYLEILRAIQTRWLKLKLLLVSFSKHWEDKEQQIST